MPAMRNILRRHSRRISEGDRQPRQRTPRRNRYYSEPPTNQSDVSVSEEEESCNFDLTVPSQHSYLGAEGEVNNQKVFYPQNSTLVIPIIRLGNDEKSHFNKNHNLPEYGIVLKFRVHGLMLKIKSTSKIINLKYIWAKL